MLKSFLLLSGFSFFLFGSDQPLHKKFKLIDISKAHCCVKRCKKDPLLKDIKRGVKKNTESIHIELSNAKNIGYICAVEVRRFIQEEQEEQLDNAVFEEYVLDNEVFEEYVYV